MKNRELIFTAVMHLAWKSYMIGAKQKINTEYMESKDSLLSALKSLDYFYTVAHEMSGPEASQEEITDAFMANVPALMHEEWMTYRESAGWVYGEVKDKVSKTHPDLVPYHSLPVAEKRKDTIICMAYLDMLHLFDSI